MPELGALVWGGQRAAEREGVITLYTAATPNGWKASVTLDGRLGEAEWLAGEFSIADIANWCWARTHPWSGVSMDGLDHLARWMAAMEARPACRRGVLVPSDMEVLTRGDSDQAEALVGSARAMVQR